MPPRSDLSPNEVVVRKEAIFKELRAVLIFVLAFFIVLLVGGMVYLMVQVYDLTKASDNSRSDLHQDTVDVITGAAYCARLPNIHTYNQMLNCIKKHTNVAPVKPTDTTPPPLGLLPVG